METAPVAVGVDGSESALGAVTVAAREAQLRGCALRVVHGLLPPLRGVDFTVMAALQEAGPRGQGEAVVTEAMEHARAAVPEVRVVPGLVADEALPAMIEATDTAQLAVIGSRGLGSFKGLLLGSMAVQLSAHGHCPVLVVRGRRDPEGPVLLAVDGSSAGAAAVDFAFAEAALRGVGVLALHVATWPDWNKTDPEVEVRETAEHVLTEGLAGLGVKYPDVAVERKAVHGSARELLVEASEHAGLLVVGARGHGGFKGLLLGSVSQALLHHAHCPVAVVRRAADEPA